MKKLSKLLVLLIMAVTVSGCKNNVSSAEIREVFFTTEDPREHSFQSLVRKTVLDENKNYTLVLDFHQPDIDIVKMIIKYSSGGEEKEAVYTLNPQYEYQTTWWNNILFSGIEGEEVFELKCFLEDKKGRRSGKYKFTVTVMDKD